MRPFVNFEPVDEEAIALKACGFKLFKFLEGQKVHKMFKFLEGQNRKSKTIHEEKHRDVCVNILVLLML